MVSETSIGFEHEFYILVTKQKQTGTEVYLSCPKLDKIRSDIKIALHPVIEHDSKNHTPTLDIEPKRRCCTTMS